MKIEYDLVARVFTILCFIKLDTLVGKVETVKRKHMDLFSNMQIMH